MNGVKHYYDSGKGRFTVGAIESVCVSKIGKISVWKIPFEFWRERGTEGVWVWPALSTIAVVLAMSPSSKHEQWLLPLSKYNELQ